MRVRLLAGPRLALGLLSVLPAGHVATDRRTAGWAMTSAPLVGVLLGGSAALVGAAARAAGLGPMVAAVLAVATLAALTRGLHLDGLADTADGLGSGRDRSRALDVLRASDIGPFGVVTVLCVVLVQVVTLAEAYDAGYGSTVLVLAVVTGRLALLWGCRRGVPAARQEGLGALVAGSVPTVVALLGSAATLAAGALAGGLSGAGPLRGAALVLTGIAAAGILLVHVHRRLGGVTGDVLGALVEVATAAALLAAAAG